MTNTEIDDLINLATEALTRGVTAVRKRPGPKPSRPCGTYAAYRRHQRAREPACEPCKKAHAEHQRAMYAQRKTRTAR